GSKAFFVCVDTPVGKDKKADLTILKTVSVQLGKVLGKGCLVSVESTLPPRTMTDVVIPLLEEGQGLKAGRDFHVVHCPERVMPGRLLLNMKSYSRVLGGIDQASIEAALVYYRQLVEAEIFPTDLTSAELCKTVENTYRDVQIAFANEVALICEQLGADAYNVRRLVNTCPFRDMHLPGSGVGGHCLTKDPWLLLSAVNEADGLISRARQINDSMPEHLADLVEESLKEAGIKLKDARLSVMGLSFLRDSDETRNSPSKVVIDRFDGKAKAVVVHDPFAQESYKVKITRQVEEALRGSDCAIFVTDHSEYLRLDLKRIKAQMRTPIIVDGRNIFNAEKCRAAGLAYRGIGKGAKPKVTSGRKGGK
ncbi:MAG: nucleotide sugar dehydrogenase, partial [Methanomassiliicoccales archaeon]|nr:nucleotide sugar dehydrogenase [Methanomassiliicoccales archaeon]